MESLLQDKMAETKSYSVVALDVFSVSLLEQQPYQKVAGMQPIHTNAYQQPMHWYVACISMHAT